MPLKAYFVPMLGMIVPIVGTVAILLAGCTAAPKRAPTPVVERVVYVPIPADLTEPLPVYQRTRETFGEAWRQAEINTSTLARCNADRAAVAAIQGSDRK